MVYKELLGGTYFNRSSVSVVEPQVSNKNLQVMTITATIMVFMNICSLGETFQLVWEL